jgi:hypothetical protein
MIRTFRASRQTMMGSSPGFLGGMGHGTRMTSIVRRPASRDASIDRRLSDDGARCAEEQAWGGLAQEDDAVGRPIRGRR